MKTALVVLAVAAVLVPAIVAYSPPDSVLAAGDRNQALTYTGAPRWTGSCPGRTFQSGTQLFRSYLLRRFPGRITDILGFSCRPNTANPSEMSVHGTGRALDVMIPTANGGRSARNDLGDAIANFLMANCYNLGVQYFIWDRKQWNCCRTPQHRFSTYDGPVPHIDHLHVELDASHGSRTSKWWSDDDYVEPLPERPYLPATPTSKCNEVGGVCMSKDECKMNGKQTRTGLCPGDSSILCCVGFCARP